MLDKKIEEQATELAKNPAWSFEAAYIGFRAGFRCEYCDRDLLASIEAYDALQLDHITATAQNGADDYLLNKALSCKMCNCLKRHTQLPGETLALTREERISQYRPIIKQRRQEKERKLAEAKGAISTLSGAA